jgi:hypothetical protein
VYKVAFGSTNVMWLCGVYLSLLIVLLRMSCCDRDVALTLIQTCLCALRACPVPLPVWLCAGCSIMRVGRLFPDHYFSWSSDACMDL